MEVITLNKAEFQQKCKLLFSKLDTHYDMVIGIETAGAHVLKEYVDFKTPHLNYCQTVKLHRKTTVGIKSRPIVNKLLRVLPETILDWLRIKEAKQSRKKIIDFTPESIDLKIPEEQITQTKTVLILDDAIDSGVTMETVRQSIVKLIPNAKITIAVIAWTFNKSLVTPDVYIYKGKLLRFWWSLDFKPQKYGR